MYRQLTLSASVGELEDLLCTGAVSVLVTTIVIKVYLFRTNFVRIAKVVDRTKLSLVPLPSFRTLRLRALCKQCFGWLAT